MESILFALPPSPLSKFQLAIQIHLPAVFLPSSEGILYGERRKTMTDGSTSEMAATQAKNNQHRIIATLALGKQQQLQDQPILYVGIGYRCCCCCRFLICSVLFRVSNQEEWGNEGEMRPFSPPPPFEGIFFSPFSAVLSPPSFSPSHGCIAWLLRDAPSHLLSSPLARSQRSVPLRGSAQP